MIFCTCAEIFIESRKWFFACVRKFSLSHENGFLHIAQNPLLWLNHGFASCATAIQLLKHSFASCATAIQLLKHSFASCATAIQSLNHSFASCATPIQLLKHSFASCATAIQSLKHSFANCATAIQSLKHSFASCATPIQSCKRVKRNVDSNLTTLRSSKTNFQIIYAQSIGADGACVLQR